jgi:hypothetical protein
MSGDLTHPGQLLCSKNPKDSFCALVISIDEFFITLLYTAAHSNISILKISAPFSIEHEHRTIIG